MALELGDLRGGVSHDDPPSLRIIPDEAEVECRLLPAFDVPLCLDEAFDETFP